MCPGKPSLRLLILTTRGGGQGQSEAPQVRDSEGLAQHWVWWAAGYFERSRGQIGDCRSWLEGAHWEHTGRLGPLPSDYINPEADANLHNYPRKVTTLEAWALTLPLSSPDPVRVLLPAATLQLPGEALPNPGNARGNLTSQMSVELRLQEQWLTVVMQVLACSSRIPFLSSFFPP